MNHIELSFAGAGGTEIYSQAWVPETPPRAILVVVHGLGEHCGRYMNVVGRLVPAGVAVYGLDHVGHGKSAGTREYLRRFSEFTETLRTFLSMVSERHPGTPVFLLGHSLGGTIVASYLLDRPSGISGAVISAPLAAVPDHVSRTTVLLGRVLSSIAPRARLIPLNPAHISRDPGVVDAYVNDPLVFHGKTTARLGAELLSELQRISSHVADIDAPLIVMQGEADKLVDPPGAKVFFDGVGSPDKTFRSYPGLYHEILNEPERDAVLDDMQAWMEARIRPSGSAEAGDAGRGTHGK